MKPDDNRCRQGRGGTCQWPLKQRQRATVKALGVVQRNVGRRVTAGELGYLAHSEVWHEFLFRLIRGQTFALPWALVDEGPVNGQEIEQMIATGLAPYHAKRPEATDEPRPQPTRTPDDERSRRIEAAKASRRKHRGGFLGV